MRMNIQRLIGTPMAEVERALILATLESCGDNKTEAAKLLGLSVRTMHYKIKRYAAGKAGRGRA